MSQSSLRQNTSMSLRKKYNKKGPTIEAWGTPFLITCQSLLTLHIITTLCNFKCK